MAEGSVTRQQLEHKVKALSSLVDNHVASYKSVQGTEMSEDFEALHELIEAHSTYHCEVHKQILDIVKDILELH